jgi:hypothetical protein
MSACEQHFQGDNPIEAALPGTIDNPDATAGDFFQQFEIAKIAYGCGRALFAGSWDGCRRINVRMLMAGRCRSLNVSLIGMVSVSHQPLNGFPVTSCFDEARQPNMPL